MPIYFHLHLSLHLYSHHSKLINNVLNCTILINYKLWQTFLGKLYTRKSTFYAHRDRMNIFVLFNEHLTHSYLFKFSSIKCLIDTRA